MRADRIPSVPYVVPFQGERQGFREFVWQKEKRLGLPVVPITHDEEDVPAHGQIIRL